MPSTSTSAKKFTDHNKKERERRFFMQRQFQDLKVILDLSPSTSKINILKEAQLECSTLKMQGDCLVSAFLSMSGQLLVPYVAGL